jgi:hypothetical protein
LNEKSSPETVCFRGAFFLGDQVQNTIYASREANVGQPVMMDRQAMAARSMQYQFPAMTLRGEMPAMEPTSRTWAP